jgi:hypothetical protein
MVEPSVSLEWFTSHRFILNCQTGILNSEKQMLLPDVISGKGRTGARMKKFFEYSPPQSARSNRARLAPKERPAIMEEIAKATADVRANIERLRELRRARDTEKE